MTTHTLMPPRAAFRRRTFTQLRVLTANTHLGQGPKLPYLLRGADEGDRARIELLHDTRAYAYHIAEWLRRNRDLYHAVGLQEVFHHALGLNQRSRRFRQRDYYTRLTGYGASIRHRVGFAAFRYENLLLSALPRAPSPQIQSLLPGRVFRLAACGFTLAPFGVDGRTIWIGNTHLHPYNPRTRARQAESIAFEIRRLGDVPILFLGDLNTVPPGCKDGDFAEGERDVRSYRGDRTLSILEDAGLRTVPHEDRAEFWTYPTGAPNRTLDYVLFTRHFEVESYRVVREFTFSDHYPVAAEFRLRA
jgi:endonuclease/exonuclease/phosphatase family metal-dependent hydrolase